MVHIEAEFVEQIIIDLITQGYSGSDLIEHFRKEVRQMHPTAKSMLAEAEELLNAL